MSLTNSDPLSGSTENFISNNIDRISALFTIMILTLLLYLRSVASSYPNTVRLFPILIINTGIILCVILAVKQIVINMYLGKKVKEKSELEEYLKGTGSQFTLRQRGFRFSAMGVWTVIFFIISSTNFLLGFTICYIGSMYTFGIREWKKLIFPVIIIDGFLYITFIQLLNIPMGVA